MAHLSVVTVDLSGKTVVVTGANTGIGLEAAKHFARMNPARLILACRTVEKGEVTATAIEKETGYSTAEGWPLELSEFSSVVAFAERFEREGVALDILVNNAAIATREAQRTSDGWETIIQVNHLSTALLTLLLIPQLSQSAHATTPLSRVVIVASGVHGNVNFGKDRISSTKILSALNSAAFLPSQTKPTRYPDSKLLNVLFTRALSEHLPSSSPIAVSSVDPGFCISDLRRSLDEAPFQELMKTARTSEGGSRTLLYAALAPTAEEQASGVSIDVMRGGYISSNIVQRPSRWVESEEGKKVQELVWDETLQILTTAAPKLKAIILKYLN